MQLDLFEHSRDVSLRNDWAQTLLRDDLPAAQSALRALADEFPDDTALGDGPLLMAAVEMATDAAALTSHEAAASERDYLALVLVPAAQRVLGAADATAWLARRWGQLAQRAAALPFVPEHAGCDAAALWLRAQAWPEARAAVERIPAWRQIPQPLAWMAQAQWQLAGLDTTWPLLAELAWRAPALAQPTLHALPDPALQRLLRHFESEFEALAEPADGAPAPGDAAAWFPAWALIEQPGLGRLLEACEPGLQSPPERAARELLALLRLERQGQQRALIVHRQRLRDLHPGLFQAYMAYR
jgi:hypothetical protein